MSAAARAREIELARHIERAREELNEMIVRALGEGIKVRVRAADQTVGGQVHPDAKVELEVFRRIEP